MPLTGISWQLQEHILWKETLFSTILDKNMREAESIIQSFASCVLVLSISSSLVFVFHPTASFSCSGAVAVLVVAVLVLVLVVVH